MRQSHKGGQLAPDKYFIGDTFFAEIPARAERIIS
jgi:hypothetical protein